MNLSVCIFLDTRVKSSILNIYTMVQSCLRVCNKRLSLSAFTAEQYQQHQEQLALMQKEQLEQIQLQQQANSTATANSTHVSIPRSLQVVGTQTALISFLFFFSDSNSFLLPRQGLANTLDQASAQFAATALVTADQLLALKTKEELGPGGGVNGVLSPSGMTTLQPTAGWCWWPWSVHFEKGAVDDWWSELHM